MLYRIIKLLAPVLLLAGCKKEEQIVTPPPPENETVTTVMLTGVNIADVTDTVSATWMDLSPNDGNPDLRKAVLNLRKDAVYNMQVLFLDQTRYPADTINNEVMERSIYHLVCFGVAGGLNLAVQRTDHDNGTPQQELGLEDKFTTTDASTGNLNVTLHHQPNQKNGDCDRGTTDVDVNFTVKIQ